MSRTTLASFYRGDTKAFDLSFTDSAGQPINVTGHELWFTLKADITDADVDAAFQKRIVFPDSSESQQGIAVLMLTSEETAGIEPGTYFFDIQKVIPETPPVVATLMSGKVSILPDVTRSVSS